MTGAYDPEQNTLFYGIGNPGPDYHSESRLGDNLYSDSLVALDADTGKLRWHYQFTPHDVHDWDATEVPILADLPIGGQTRKVVMFANRNGFYYTLDRITGKVIVGKPFVKTTWANEIGADGRPVLLPGHTPDEKGEVTCPDIAGGTNFWPGAYDPSTRTFFVNAREACMTFYAWKPEYKQGERFTGGAGQRVKSADMPVYGALRALDPATGERKWEFKYLNLSTAGLMTTASGLIFTSDGDGNLLALDSRERQAAVAIPDGGDDARDIADHIHGGRQAAPAGAGRDDPYGVGVAVVAGLRSSVFGLQSWRCGTAVRVAVRPDDQDSANR